MKLKSILIAGASLMAITASASAAAVNIPDLSGGGSFTVGVGDTSSSSTFIASADDAVATLTVNGTWTLAGEVQLGGLNSLDASQMATLNIGSAGHVTLDAFWIAGGWGSPVGATTIDISTGGQLTMSGGNFGVRAIEDFSGADQWTMDGVNEATAGTADAAGVYEMLWNTGVLSKDGANVGTFAQNFTFTENGSAAAGTLTAVPEPSSAALLGLGGLALILRRRK